MLSASDLRAIQNVIEVSQKPIKEEQKSLRGDLLTFKDEILSEVQAMRQELSIVIGYRDQIEDHEIRIDKLESKARSN